MGKIVHLIPYDGIGGVETAARSIPDSEYETLHFQKYYLVNKNRGHEDKIGNHGPQVTENSLRAFLAAIRYVLKSRPDILIGSLWRSYAVLVIAKLLRPKTKVVAFLHLPKSVHAADWLLSCIAMRISSEIWADSVTTLVGRIPSSLQGRGRVISFVTRRAPEFHRRPPRPLFYFWGRLHPQKNLAAAFKIFDGILREDPSAHYTVIGPDGGCYSELTSLAQRMGIAHAITFTGPVTADEIRERSSSGGYYLQTSRNEGMAMSVVEAMQLGLVPVVAPVGEIARYCIHGVNSILVEEGINTEEEVLRLLRAPRRYERVSRAAFDTWARQPLYSDDILKGCEELLSVQG